MAFVRVEEWNLADMRVGHSPGYSANRSLMDAIIHTISGTRTRAILALIATIVVHIALLLFILLRLSKFDNIVRQEPGAAMTLIDLSGAASSDRQDVVAASHGTPPHDPKPPEVEKSPLTVPVVPEWVMVKVRVAHVEQASPALPAKPASATQAPIMAANNQGSGGGYDPYAGSAPRWRDPPLAAQPSNPSLPSPAMSMVKLDAAMAKRLRKLLANTGARADQPLRVRFAVDRDERIVAATLIEPMLDQQPNISSMFKGKRISCIVEPSDCSMKSSYGAVIDVNA